MTTSKFLGIVLISLALGAQAADASPRPVKSIKAPPAIDVEVDISTQTMDVSVNGFPYASWKVSTARPGYYTPRGTFYAKGLERLHLSRKYDNTPMPNSIFFHYGFAIHATNVVSRLGTPASHGCVRLHPSNAAELYSLVQEYGIGRTRIHLFD